MASSIEKFLMPDENITFSSSEEVEIDGKSYSMYITNKRFIWYMSKGLISKKKSVITTPIDQVKNIKYDEKGIFRKKANIEITTVERKYEVAGSASAIGNIYKTMQSHMFSTNSDGSQTK